MSDCCDGFWIVFFYVGVDVGEFYVDLVVFGNWRCVLNDYVKIDVFVVEMIGFVVGS